MRVTEFHLLELAVAETKEDVRLWDYFTDNSNDHTPHEGDNPIDPLNTVTPHQKKGPSLTFNPVKQALKWGKMKRLENQCAIYSQDQSLPLRLDGALRLWHFL